MGGDETDVLLPTTFLGEAKGATPKAEVADLDSVVCDLAAGKSDRELKAAATKHPILKENLPYMRELVSGGKIAQLEKEGKLTRGPDGKFI